MTRTAFLLVALAVTAARGPAADHKVVVTPKSEQKPSADAAEPAPLKLAQYAAGRLGNSEGTGRYHYWSLDLAAGDYTVVLDSHRSDGHDSNVCVGVKLCDPATGKPAGVNLVMTNTSYGRDRDTGILRVKVAGPTVLRVDNGAAMADYQLAVVKKGAGFSSPWLLKPKEVQPMELGVEVQSAKLNGGDLFDRDAFYALDLDEGDFEVTVRFADATPGLANSGVKVDLLNADGRLVQSLIWEYGSRASGRASAKVVTAGEGRLYVRVRGCSPALTATLKIEAIAPRP